MIRGFSYDFYSQQLISTHNVEQIKQLVGSTFDNKIEYYQVEPLKEQLTFILKEIGYQKAVVHVEKHDGNDRFVADLEGGFFTPQNNPDYYAIHKGLKSALEEKTVTSKGADLRNQESLKKQQEEKKEASKMQPFMATEFDITHKKDGEVVLPDIEDVKLPLINIEIPENEKSHDQIIASLQAAQVQYLRCKCSDFSWSEYSGSYSS